MSKPWVYFGWPVKQYKMKRGWLRKSSLAPPQFFSGWCIDGLQISANSKIFFILFWSLKLISVYLPKEGKVISLLASRETPLFQLNQHWLKRLSILIQINSPLTTLNCILEWFVSRLQDPPPPKESRVVERQPQNRNVSSPWH